MSGQYLIRWGSIMYSVELTFLQETRRKDDVYSADHPQKTRAIEPVLLWSWVQLQMAEYFALAEWKHTWQNDNVKNGVAWEMIFRLYHTTIQQQLVTDNTSNGVCQMGNWQLQN